MLNWVDLRALGSFCLTQAGTAAAWAPMQSLHDLGHCLTRFPWVVMGFSNLEPTHQSLGVGRIVLALPFPLEMMENIWSFSASGQELLAGSSCLVICIPRHGAIPNCFWEDPNCCCCCISAEGWYLLPEGWWILSTYYQFHLLQCRSNVLFIHWFVITTCAVLHVHNEGIGSWNLSSHAESSGVWWNLQRLQT